MYAIDIRQFMKPSEKTNNGTKRSTDFYNYNL